MSNGEPKQDKQYKDATNNTVNTSLGHFAYPFHKTKGLVK